MFRTNTLNHTNARRPGLGYFLTLILASLLAIIVSAGLARGQDTQKLNRLVQNGNPSDPADEILREGRKLIDDKKWDKAAEKFGVFVNDHPNHKNVDAALFLRAYAFMQQRKYEEARESAERVINEHPRSTWKKDAEALIIQIPARSGERPDPSLYKDEELKIIALQSLFQRDPAQAIRYAAEWLKPGSGRSREAKEAAISLLGQYGGAQGAAMLADIVRNEPNEDLRSSAIHWVAQRGTLNDLIQLFDSEKSADVKSGILHWIAKRKEEAAMSKLMQVAKSDPSLEVRQSAIHWIAQRGGPQGTATLIQLFDSEQNEDMRSSMLHWLAQRYQDPAAANKLMQVAKSDPSLEVRQSAIHWLGQRGTTEMLIQLYDSEKNEDVKNSILHSIYQRSRGRKSADGSQGDAAALRKLIEVAKTDPDTDLRSSAIHWVSQAEGRQGLDLLFELYSSEKNVDVKSTILHRLAQRREPEALAKLNDVVRNEPNEELRRSAIHWVAKRAGDQGVDSLIQFYDAEKSEEVKEGILHWLGQAARNPAAGDSPQKRALRKLFQVAKSDSSVEMRKQAIHWLGQSKDPEAAKFIEEIVRQ